MFELVKCQNGRIIHETLTYDQVIMRFKSTRAEASVNGWIGTCRTGETLELTDVLLIICME